MIDVSLLGAAITVGGTVTVAFVTGLLTYAAGHRKAATEAQTAIHAGFKILIDELQEENKKFREERKALTREIGELKLEVHTMGLQLTAMAETLRRHDIPVPKMYLQGLVDQLRDGTE